MARTKAVEAAEASPTPIRMLRILDENGEADERLAGRVDDDLLLRMHRAMLLTRRFDERLLNLQRRGEVGTFAPVTGQEAAQIGSVSAIGDDDWMVPSFRETAAIIWRGTPLEGIFVFTAGYNEGQRIPDGQKDLPNCVPVGTHLPHAVGIAYAIRHRREKGVVMVYFGDGATSEGDFHEALNFAGVAGLPVVFVCQNNQWAISVPRDKQTGSETLAQKAVAYGFPGVQVDGNDVLAVHRAAVEAVERARKHAVPTLIECVTYRMQVHTTADDPTRYRSDDEVAAWRKRDPLDRLERYLARRGLLDQKAVRRLGKEVKAEIDQAWDAAKARMAELDDPAVMFDHMFAEMPPHLAAQREAFRRRQAAGRRKGGRDDG